MKTYPKPDPRKTLTYMREQRALADFEISKRYVWDKVLSPMMTRTLERYKQQLKKEAT